MFDDALLWGLFGLAIAILLIAFGVIWGKMMCAEQLDIEAKRTLAARIAVGKVAGRLANALDDLDRLEKTGAGDLLYTDAHQEIGASLHILQALQWGTGRYFQHLKRKSYYEILAPRVPIQVADPLKLEDDAELVLYADLASGKLYARPAFEFWDGRFKAVGRAEALEAGEPAGLGVLPEPAPRDADDAAEGVERATRRP